MKARKNNRILSAVLSILGFSQIMPTAYSATLFWDGNDSTTNADGGAGTWNTSATNWDTAAFGGSNASWSNANPDFAVFAGTAGTVTLGENITAGGLLFETTAYAINADTNALSFSGNSPVIFNNIAAATLTGTVSGTGNVSLAAIRPTTTTTLTLNGTSTGGWSGTTTVGNGTAMTLAANQQALLNTSGISLSGGTITLTNTNATEAALNRVADGAAITSNGGTINFTNTSGANFYAESIGAVTASSGTLNIVLTTNQASTGSQTLTLAGLTRTGATNSSAVAFAAGSALNTTKNMLVVTGATATATNQIIGPWATTGTTSAAQTDYAVYNASGQVVPRAVATSAETTWTNSANTYTLGAAATLTATRTPGSLRYTGAAANLTLGTSTFSLQTYGVLNGGSGVLTIQNGTGGTGALTTPTGGGFLHLNAGNNGITVSAPVNDNGGAVTLVKNGSGALTLSSATSSFSGGVVVNGGTLTTTTDTNLGAAAGNLTFNGSANFNTGSVTYARSIAINNGSLVSFGNANPTFSGNLTGTGGIAMNTGFGSQVVFSGTANTFQGPILIGSTGTTGQAYRFSFASLADSATANGRIILNSNFVTHANGSVFEYSGGSNLTLNNRQIELASSTGNPLNGHQIRRTGSGTLTVNTNLIVSTNAPQTLSLAGANTTGVNVFAGVIGDRPVLVTGSTPLDAIFAANATSVTLGSIKGISVGSPISGTGIATGTTITAINPSTRVVTLSLAASGAGTIGQTMTIPGVYNPISLSKVDAGSWRLTATNTYTGDTTISAGTLQISGSGSLGGGNYAGLIANAGTLNYSSSANQTLSGIISGVGSIVKDTATSTLTLSGANTFSGNVTLNNGTLSGTTTGAFGSNGLARAFTVAAGATLRFDVGNIFQPFSSANVPTFTVAGTVINNFANNNALTNVTLNGGTITATAGSANYGAFRFNGTVTSTGTSTISTSDAVSGRMMLRDEGSIFDVTSGTLTISAPLAAVVREGNVGALVKNGAGTLLLSGANSYSGSTTVNAGITTVSGAGTLGSGVASLSVNNASTVLNLNTTLDTNVGSLTGTGAAVINNGGAGRNFTVRQTVAGTYAGDIAGAGDFTLAATSTNALTLSGPLSYTGATTVNGGTLRLAYSAGSSKLSDTAPLTLGGGTIEMSDSGTPHTEIVASTTLTAGTASRVTRSAGTSVLQMNAITPGAGASIDFAADNIATTDTLNTNGILGTWATVGGTNWATNSTNAADGLIVAYSAYTDVARLDGSSQVINDNSTANVRIIEGTGTAANNTLGSATTVINSLLQSDVGGTGAATIAMGGQTLRTNTVLVATSAGALTFGSTPNSGTLTTATAGGTLILTNNSVSDLTVNAAIADNVSASGLSKLGTGWLVLSGNNSYTGATTVSGGVLSLLGSLTGTAISVNANAQLNQDALGVIAGSSSVTLTSTATSTLAGANTYSGGTTLNAGNLILAHASALGTGTFTINGGGFNTDGSVTSLAANNAMTWNGSFSYNGASALNLGTGAVTLTANSQVNVSSNTLTVGGVIGGAFTLTKTGAGTLVLNGANVHSGGTFLSGATTAGTLILGHPSALGTGPVTFNSQNDQMTVDTTIPDFVNANNNAINFQGNVIFTGSQNMDLGTGLVTLLGNRSITINGNTLKFGGGISGGFNFTKAGDGQLVLSGVNTYTGTSTFNGVGAVTIAGTGSLGAGNYSAAITNNSGLVFASSASQTLSGVISGSGSITKSGSNLMVLSGVNTYTGSTAVSAGTLTIGNASALGTGTDALDGTTIGSGATLDLNGVSNGANSATGSERITVSGTGVGGNGAIVSSSQIGTPFIGVRYLTLAGNTTLGFSNRWDVGSATAANNGFVGGGHNLTFLGAGSTAAASLNFLGETNLGDINVNMGSDPLVNILYLQGDTTLGQAGKTVTISGGSTLQFFTNTTPTSYDKKFALDNGLLNFNRSNATISLPGTISLTNTNTITCNVNTTTVNASNEISGTGSLIKAGPGVLALSGTNVYSGLTTVDGGVLRISHANALGGTTNGIVVNGTNTGAATNARLELSGGIVVTGESAVLRGNGNFLGALQSFSGSNEWAGNVTIDADLTRIGAAAGAALLVSGVIDDGINDYRLMYRVSDAAASVTLTGANTYTGPTSIVGIGPVIVSSLNKVVGGTASSNLGAPITEANGRITIGTTSVNGTLHYVGAGETTDRTIQIGENNSTTPAAADTGGSTIENNGIAGALVFNAPLFNTPTNALTGTTPARTLTLGGSNTNANTISGVIQNNQIAGISSAAVNLTKTGVGSWILSGENVYTGATTVNEGTLAINNTYNVAAGGTTSRLLVGTTTGFTGALTIGSSAGVINFGGDGYANAVQVGINGGTGIVTMNGGTVSLVGNNGTAASSLNIGVQVGTGAGTGTVTVNNGTLNVGQRILLGANNIASSGVLTIAGGTVDVGTNGTLGYTGANPGVVILGTGTATVNLDGGSLNVFGFKSHGSGTATINFNGGTVVAKGSPSFFLGNNGNGDTAPSATGVYNTVVKSGGAILNTNGFNITIPSAMVVDPLSTGGGLTKNGLGTLTLTGANTYTGATSVTAGTLAFVGGSQASPVTVSAGASLGFTLGSPTTSTSTFNLSAGTIKITGTPTLNSHDLITSSAGITGTPVLDAPIAGYELKVVGNSLKLVKLGYAAWAGLNGAGANLNDDHDNDGVPNGVEYFLGGPNGNTTGFTPVPGVTNTAGTLSVTWVMGSGYAGVYGTDFTVETSDILTGTWTTENSPGNVTISGSNVTYTFPAPLGAKRFARLKVTGP